MGVSTNAILFYGFCWDEEVDLFPGDEDGTSEWEDAIARKRGAKSPWDDFPGEYRTLPYSEQRRRTDAWVAGHRKEIDAWSAARRAVKNDYGVDVGYHCSGECPMPYLYVVESRLVVHRGHPHALERWPAAGWEWDEMLARFAADLGIELPAGGPKWWLCSYWG